MVRVVGRGLFGGWGGEGGPKWEALIGSTRLLGWRAEVAWKVKSGRFDG